VTDDEGPKSGEYEAMAPIEWRAFDPYPEDTLTCRCGAVYRSHAKFVIKPRSGLLARKPCPKCGRVDDIRRASSDPEVVRIDLDRHTVKIEPPKK